jgi:hypothetical protein
MYIRHPVLPMFRRRQTGQPAEEESHLVEARIARIWRGRTRRARANAYEPYLREVGILPLEEKALAVQLFREDRETETEFVTVSYWENIDAMSGFTGGDPTRIHHLPRDGEFLVELPERVQVLRILVNAEGQG